MLKAFRPDSISRALPRFSHPVMLSERDPSLRDERESKDLALSRDRRTQYAFVARAPSPARTIATNPELPRTPFVG
jgi:hypothetical protein